MATRAPRDAAMIDTAALGRLMPMHVGLGADGRINSIGPTLQRVAGADLRGCSFLERFEIRRPAGIVTIADLHRHCNQRLLVAMRGAAHSAMRGLAVAGADGGLVLNLSFGINLPAAVSEYQLVDGDFAPTDLAMELLCLIEMMSLTLGEMRALNLRLQGAKSQAERAALTDTLTGLANRRALDARLEALIAGGQPFGLVHVDLDYFKQINDTYGHAVGDAVLKHAGQLLLGVIRQQDLAARVGGDEFILLLPGVVDPALLDRIGRRVIAALEGPLPVPDGGRRISASIGTTVSTNYRNPDTVTMLQDADSALYRAKRAGRGQVRACRPTDDAAG